MYTKMKDICFGAHHAVFPNSTFRFLTINGGNQLRYILPEIIFYRYRTDKSQNIHLFKMLDWQQSGILY